MGFSPHQSDSGLELASAAVVHLIENILESPFPDQSYGDLGGSTGGGWVSGWAGDARGGMGETKERKARAHQLRCKPRRLLRAFRCGVQAIAVRVQRGCGRLASRCSCVSAAPALLRHERDVGAVLLDAEQLREVDGTMRTGVSCLLRVGFEERAQAQVIRGLVASVRSERLI